MDKMGEGWPCGAATCEGMLDTGKTQVLHRKRMRPGTLPKTAHLCCTGSRVWSVSHHVGVGCM